MIRRPSHFRRYTLLSLICLLALLFATTSHTPAAHASATPQIRTFANGIGGYAGHDFTTIGFDFTTPLASLPFVEIVDRFGPAPDGREIGGHNGLLRFREVFGCGVGQVPHNPILTDAQITMNLFQTTLAGGTVANSPLFDQQVDIFGMRRPFDQTTATWYQAAAGVPWEQDGALGYTDRDSLPESSVLTTLPGDYTWSVTNSFQQHLDQGRDLAWMILSPDALKDNGDNTRWSNARLAVSYISSQLSYGGSAQVSAAGALAVSATLTDPDGTPVANAPVTFALGTQQAAVTTGPAGQVNVTLPAPATVGSYTLVGDAPGVLHGTPGACLRQPIQVVSNTAPTISVSNSAKEANTTGGWGLTFAAIGAASDAEDGTPSVACIPPVGTVLPLGATSVTCIATDSGGLTANASGMINVVDTTPPAISCPAPVIQTIGQSVVLGQPSVADIADAQPTVSNNAPAGFPIGTTIVTWSATDHSGNVASCTQSVKLSYVFSSFDAPVDNLPMINQAKAGQTIPIKWSLKDSAGSFISDLGAVANYGFASLANCTGSSDVIEEYAGAGATGLHYDASTNQYILNAKTDKSWANSCKVFMVVFSDGTQYQARFNFVK